jgi:hypothetical protein
VVDDDVEGGVEELLAPLCGGQPPRRRTPRRGRP